jgi:hypothetical protein
MSSQFQSEHLIRSLLKRLFQLIQYLLYLTPQRQKYHHHHLQYRLQNQMFLMSDRPLF